MHRIGIALLAAALATGCSTAGDSAAPSTSAAPSPKPSPTVDPSDRALARTPPFRSAPATVEDVQLDGNPWDAADGQAAYLAALRTLEVLRQNPDLLRSGNRTREDFAEVLQVSTPDHRAYLDKRIDAFLRAQEDPSDTGAAELGDELRSAMTIALRPADQGASAQPSPEPGETSVRFRSYDPKQGAFGVLSVARTAVYECEPTGGGTALAVAFDVYARYNIISHAGEPQLATIMITDFRMVMAEDRGEWLWDGWDMEDVRVDIQDQPA